MLTLVTGRRPALRLGSGLDPNTASKYKDEWSLYRKWCAREGIREVPGRDRPWVVDVAARYLWWRAARNNIRSLTQIRCKLKHCSLCYGHLLPTAKGEGPTTLRLQLAMIMEVIRKKKRAESKAAGKPSGPKRSLALGQVAVGMLFSAYGATSAARFRRLPARIQAWLTRCASMHTGGMRFGLLKDLWQQAKTRWSGLDKAYRMASDWRKMKRGGAFSVPFPAEPQFEAMRYPVFDQAGVKVGSFTAAEVITWRMEAAGSARSRHLFATKGEVMPSRDEFQRFIRMSFRRLLVGDRDEINALVDAMTPHSFRAGLASDLHRSGVPVKQIMKLGRWESERAMSQYVRDGLAQRLTSAKFASVRKEAREVVKLVCKASSHGR